MNNILVIRGGAIGDFILTIPLLSALQKQYPAARIEILGNPFIVALAKKFELTDDIRDLGSLAFAPLFSCDGLCSADVAAWLSAFDLIVSYTYDPERIFENNIRRYTKAQFVKGPHRPDEHSNAHASAQLLAPLGIVVSSPSADQSLDGAGEGRFNSTSFNLRHSTSTTKIAIHPGSGSPQKNWPMEKWRAFLEHLVATTDDKILLIGGEAERDRLPSLAEIVPPNRREIALEIPLVDLADRLKDCRVFIGHDSGITHLAAILGLECIVLWGPSNERVWRPLGERVHVLRHPQSIRHLPVKAVAEALNSLLTTS